MDPVPSPARGMSIDDGCGEGAAMADVSSSYMLPIYWVSADYVTRSKHHTYMFIEGGPIRFDRILVFTIVHQLFSDSFGRARSSTSQLHSADRLRKTHTMERSLASRMARI